MDKSNYILQTFLKLTTRTYPYGTEDELFGYILDNELIPSDIHSLINRDDHGNYFLTLGDSRTIFACHLDTASKDVVEINHIIKDNIISTDNTTILGADDKAGVTILLNLIKNRVNGTYYFFIGEEVGCIGSGLAAKNYEFDGKYDRIISFDRRDVGSVITYQSSSRCCSDEFADALCEQLNKSGKLNYSKDDGGVYTDSAEFTKLIPECTNISVGYYKEHTVYETQDIKHLELLANELLSIDWDSLPTKRDKTKEEKKYWTYTNHNKYYDNYYDDYTVIKDTDSRSRDTGFGYHDDWYEQNTNNFDNWPGEDEYNKYKKKKKRKRSNSKQGNKYFDGGSGSLIPFNEKTSNISISKINDKNYYDAIIEKLLDNNLTKDELEIIKDSYLDMDSKNDKLFYNFLLGNVID